MFRAGWLLIGFVAFAASVWAAPAGRGPYIGYVYPAGGQQGTVFRATVAGQRLNGAREVFVSGAGVSATVVGYEGPGGPLNRLQQEELRRRLAEIRDKRTGGIGQALTQPKGQSAVKDPSRSAPATANAEPVTLPDLPELRNLESKTLRQLQLIADKFLNPAKRPKPPIAEQVTVQVRIDADAAPGDRELRIRGPNGFSNPLVIQVGRMPEIRERDRYDENTSPLPPATPPVVLNGRIFPGEVDRFPLQLKAGRRLVIAVQARKLIPYLADAVPGWFQAVVSLYGPDGGEVAFCDDCGFDPDPALVYEVPRDGQYTLVIRDSIYRGREDFVYRVYVGDESTLAPLFCMGRRGGVELIGAHRDLAKLARDRFGGDVPISAETEPNETGRTSIIVKTPRVITGCISKPGDRDVFAIDGRAGDQVVAEVYARRMGSALDSVLRLIDPKGRVVASDDDHEDIESGLLTHKADSYLCAKLPSSGRYFVALTDVQSYGGPTYDYCLRISPPQSDFALIVTPSALNVPAGRAAVMTVYAVRRDGWDGDIDITLADAPPGFTLSGARIPQGCNKVRMTLQSPARGRGNQYTAVSVEGCARIGGKTVTRRAVPADEMMQAFAYQHLVPAQQLMLTVTPGGLISPSLDMAKGERLAIPAGGSAEVSFSVRSLVRNTNFELALSDPPPGITLTRQEFDGDKVTLTLSADDKHAGYADNLIVELLAEVAAGRGQNPNAPKQKMSAGVLPAIPFEIVKR